MSELAKVSLIMGGLLLPCYFAMVISPKKALTFIKGFPRNRKAALILTAIWTASVLWMLLHVEIAFLVKYKQALYIAAPVVYVLVVKFVDELLAARALGFLMLLAPVYLLDAAQWHPSNARYYVSALAYIMVIKGLLLTFNPYLFRKSVERFLKTENQCIPAGIFGLVMTVVLLALALFVY